MQTDWLTEDCSQCAALCCLAHAIDKSPLFAMDKPAGIGCPNLSTTASCKIHDALSDKGFQGCINYTCHGAGQRVTQEIFQGKSWQSDPSLTLPMINAFLTLRRVHELVLMLQSALKLPLSAEQIETCQAMIADLSPNAPISENDLNAIIETGAEKRATQFFASLKSVAENRL